MTQRKPLVQNNGTLAELPAGDTLPPAALGTGAADVNKVLRGDGTWGAAPGGGTPINSVVTTVNGVTYTVTTYA